MNLILLNSKDFISDKKVLITGRRAEHIILVHRAEIGRELTVGLINNKIGIGIVVEISKNKIIMEVSLTEEPPPPIPLTLILALPRPKSLKKAVHIATTLGIKKIILLETWKVEKSYWQSPLLKQEELEKHLILGLEQAKDTLMPEVVLNRCFKPFIEDEAPSLIKETTPFIAHPANAIPCPYNISKPVTLAIGPEGGFTDYEVKKFTDIGFTPITIGSRIQRVEFAIPTIFGKLF